MCRDINRFPIKRGFDRESTPIRSGFFARKGESLYKLCRFNKSSESCELINEMKRDTRRRGYVCCAKWTRLCERMRARAFVAGHVRFLEMKSLIKRKNSDDIRISMDIFRNARVFKIIKSALNQVSR